MLVGSDCRSVILEPIFVVERRVPRGPNQGIGRFSQSRQESFQVPHGVSMIFTVKSQTVDFCLMLVVAVAVTIIAIAIAIIAGRVSSAVGCHL